MKNGGVSETYTIPQTPLRRIRPNNRETPLRSVTQTPSRLIPSLSQKTPLHISSTNDYLPMTTPRRFRNNILPKTLLTPMEKVASEIHRDLHKKRKILKNNIEPAGDNSSQDLLEIKVNIMVILLT